MTNPIATPIPLDRFDAFAREFLANDDRASLRASIAIHCNSNMIDNDSIIDYIDAQFDDDFAIICDDDANNESLFIEYIECNRIAFANYLAFRIARMIA